MNALDTTPPPSLAGGGADPESALQNRFDSPRSKCQPVVMSDSPPPIACNSVGVVVVS
jgi:hypothetical protein